MTKIIKFITIQKTVSRVLAKAIQVRLKKLIIQGRKNLCFMSMSTWEQMETKELQYMKEKLQKNLLRSLLRNGVWMGRCKKDLLRCSDNKQQEYLRKQMRNKYPAIQTILRTREDEKSDEFDLIMRIKLFITIIFSIFKSTAYIFIIEWLFF